MTSPQPIVFPGGDSRAHPQPVMVTGVGIVSPLGSRFTVVADRLLAGHSGVQAIDPGAHGRAARQFAAPVDCIPQPPKVCGIVGSQLAGLDRLAQMCLAPAADALADAGLAGATRPDAMRIGIVVGLGAEHLKSWELDFLAGGTSVLEPRRMPTLVGRLAELLRLDGPAVTVAAACGSSGYALAVARAWLDAGQVDACVAGGCDILSPTTIAAFYNLRALSRRDDDPARASRPFDRDRDGFVIGEGGAFFVLERQGEATARGATLRAELAGIGMSSDAAHMVIPSAEATHATAAITAALVDAGVTPDDVDYVNAHAAGTPVGDVAEALAIRQALGAATDAVPVSSTKGMTGHLVSGAAAFEAAACLVALERQTVPPTVNLDHPDERCRLDHVPLTARPRRVRVAVSNSFGFGGSNLCLVLRRAA